MYNVQFTLYTVHRSSSSGYIGNTCSFDVHCTLYSVQCTVYSVHCTLCIVQCTLYTVQCKMCNVHCTLYIVHYTLFSVQCTVYIAHCALNKCLQVVVINEAASQHRILLRRHLLILRKQAVYSV